MVALVLAGQCWPKYSKNQHSSALKCAPLAKNANLNVMGYFDFFLTFTDKNSCFKINIDEFNASISRYPGRHTNIGTDI